MYKGSKPNNIFLMDLLKEFKHRSPSFKHQIKAIPGDHELTLEIIP